MGRKPATDAGISLASVLVLLALLSVLITSFLYLNRDLILTTTNRVELTKAQAEADGLYELSLLLITTDLIDPTPPDGQSRVCQFGRSKVEITIEDEAGKIDLNGASEDLLWNLIRLYTGSDEEAWRALDVIVDYRDSDDIARTRGAELEDYIRDGLETVPKNSVFVLREELFSVPYLPDTLVRAILPHTTTHSQRSGIAPPYASAPVLFAASGIQPDDSLDIEDFETRDSRADLTSNIPSERISPSDKQAYRITLHILRDTGFAFAQQAVFRFPQQLSQPLFVERTRVNFTAEKKTQLTDRTAEFPNCKGPKFTLTR